MIERQTGNYTRKNDGTSITKSQLVQNLLSARKHKLLDDKDLVERNKAFFDHFSVYRLDLCPCELAHKTHDTYVIIGKPLKHTDYEIRRASLIPNKFAKGSLFEDPETPIVEGTHLIEAINQLGSYILEEKETLFSVAKFVGLENRILSKSIMKQEKHASIEIGGIETTTLPGGTIVGTYRATVYKGKIVIGGGSVIFSVEPYKEDMVEKDLLSGDAYKVKRAQAFVRSVQKTQ